MVKKSLSPVREPILSKKSMKSGYFLGLEKGDKIFSITYEGVTFLNTLKKYRSRFCEC